MNYVNLGKSGLSVPVLGMGTWGDGFRLGDSFSKAVKALRKGIDLGMTLIDTAEIYGWKKDVKQGLGFSEKIVGEAIKGRRDEVFVATKVLSQNLAYDNVIKAAENSLSRLDIRTIDLYQIHQPNPNIPIKETMRAMEHLMDKGKIRSIGVCNFSLEQIKGAQESLSKYELASVQTKYNIINLGIEHNILPYCQQQKISVIAYSPLAQGMVLKGNIHILLKGIGRNCGKTPVQVALNWLITKPGVIAIPKTINIKHLLENVGAVY